MALPQWSTVVNGAYNHTVFVTHVLHDCTLVEKQLSSRRVWRSVSPTESTGPVTGLAALVDAHSFRHQVVTKCHKVKSALSRRHITSQIACHKAPTTTPSLKHCALRWRLDVPTLSQHSPTTFHNLSPTATLYTVHRVSPDRLILTNLVCGYIASISTK